MMMVIFSVYRTHEWNTANSCIAYIINNGFWLLLASKLNIELNTDKDNGREQKPMITKLVNIFFFVAAVFWRLTRLIKLSLMIEWQYLKEKKQWCLDDNFGKTFVSRERKKNHFSNQVGHPHSVRKEESNVFVDLFEILKIWAPSVGFGMFFLPSDIYHVIFRIQNFVCFWKFWKYETKNSTTATAKMDKPDDQSAAKIFNRI